MHFIGGSGNSSPFASRCFRCSSVRRTLNRSWGRRLARFSSTRCAATLTLPNRRSRHGRSGDPRSSFRLRCLLARIINGSLSRGLISFRRAECVLGLCSWKTKTGRSASLLPRAGGNKCFQWTCNTGRNRPVLLNRHLHLRRRPSSR